MTPPEPPDALALAKEIEDKALMDYPAELDKQITASLIAVALESEHARGRREGLEEAARIAESCPINIEACTATPETVVDIIGKPARRQIAAAIRAAKGEK